MPNVETLMNERQRQIVRRVESQGYATIEALAQEFDVSSQTIRRDIIQLDKFRILQRFHGGAGLPGDTVRLAYRRKKSVSVEGKHRIGEAAAALVPDGATVFLDVGTTVEAVAQALNGRDDLHVFTNSLVAAMALAGGQARNVVVTGGVLNGADGSLVGDEVTRTIERFKFDVAVIGCSGFDDDGTVMDFDLQKVAVKTAALANARQSVLVAHGGKFTRTAFVRVAAPADFSHLVTDAPPPPALARALDAGGVQVIVA
ncbi:MAG: DeoR/GlpR transcriptional regulator [Hyphomicrobiales bacterium]|nr:DeoR/GlpR transcriptional regulator [Hyphomicrobiales bacterium]MCP5370353.1 DeoR/GlpR transcriptional regulator [Hyphomicrobiales bacterium]